MGCRRSSRGDSASRAGAAGRAGAGATIVRRADPGRGRDHERRDDARRHVLIYVDVQAKADVLDRLANQLVPGGVVLLGGSETTLGITDALERCGAAGVYGPADERRLRADAVAVPGPRVPNAA